MPQLFQKQLKWSLPDFADTLSGWAPENSISIWKQYRDIVLVKLTVFFGILFICPPRSVRQLNRRPQVGHQCKPWKSIEEAEKVF